MPELGDVGVCAFGVANPQSGRGYLVQSLYDTRKNPRPDQGPDVRTTLPSIP